MEYPKTRKEAQLLGVTHYFTGEPCKHGHIALRKTKGVCVECLKLEWQLSAEKRVSYFAEYNKRPEVQDAKNAWYIANREQVIATANLRPVEDKRAYKNKWKANNPLWVKADTKARRRKHREATPKWLTKKQRTEIRQMYQIAMTMTSTTGEQYVVDHIVPLRAEIVCGLHVPWNLRVITREENMSKSNKMLDPKNK